MELHLTVDPITGKCKCNSCISWLFNQSINWLTQAIYLISLIDQQVWLHLPVTPPPPQHIRNDSQGVNLFQMPAALTSVIISEHPCKLIPASNQLQIVNCLDSSNERTRWWWPIPWYVDGVSEWVRIGWVSQAALSNPCVGCAQNM